MLPTSFCVNSSKIRKYNIALNFLTVSRRWLRCPAFSNTYLRGNVQDAESHNMLFASLGKSKEELEDYAHFETQTPSRVGKNRGL
jgi:hypothetical protein